MYMWRCMPLNLQSCNPASLPDLIHHDTPLFYTENNLYILTHEVHDTELLLVISMPLKINVLFKVLSEDK